MTEQTQPALKLWRDQGDETTIWVALLDPDLAGEPIRITQAEKPESFEWLDQILRQYGSHS